MAGEHTKCSRKNCNCIHVHTKIISGDSINHPAHYGGHTTYETIKVIEAWELGFCLGNAVKYISRAGKKDQAKTVEDLKKARWYLDREIQNLELPKRKEVKGRCEGCNEPVPPGFYTCNGDGSHQAI